MVTRPEAIDLTQKSPRIDQRTMGGRWGSL